MRHRDEEAFRTSVPHQQCDHWNSVGNIRFKGRQLVQVGLEQKGKSEQGLHLLNDLSCCQGPNHSRWLLLEKVLLYHSGRNMMGGKTGEREVMIDKGLWDSSNSWMVTNLVYNLRLLTYNLNVFVLQHSIFPGLLT